MQKILSLESVMRFNADTREIDYYLENTYNIPSSYNDPIVEALFESEFKFMREANEGDAIGTEPENKDERGIFTKIKDALVNFVKKIIEFIKKIVSSIKGMVTTGWEKKSIKEGIAKFKKIMSENPEVRKEKVEVTKVDGYMKDLDKLAEETKKCGENAKKGKLTENQVASKLKDIGDKAVKYTANTAKDAAVILTMETALRECQYNHKLAEQLALQLEKENNILSSLPESVVSKDDIEKFKADVQNCVNMGKFSQLWAKIKYRQARTLDGAIRSTMNSMSSILIDAERKSGDERLYSNMLNSNLAVPMAVSKTAKTAVPAAKKVKKGLTSGVDDIVNKYSKK